MAEQHWTLLVCPECGEETIPLDDRERRCPAHEDMPATLKRIEVIPARLLEAAEKRIAELEAELKAEKRRYGKLAEAMLGYLEPDRG